MSLAAKAVFTFIWEVLAALLVVTLLSALGGCQALDRAYWTGYALGWCSCAMLVFVVLHVRRRP
jgi:hypothetical protein